MPAPKIVCLCGSTRFWKQFEEQGLAETLAGNIVLSIGIARPSAIVFAQDLNYIEVKKRLDELHKRKIDLCDEVFVLNVDGYVGESTRSEIDYAIDHQKPIRWLEE